MIILEIGDGRSRNDDFQQEVQLFKDGQLRQRYIPSCDLPDHVELDEVQAKKDVEGANPKKRALSTAGLIPALLRRATTFRIEDTNEDEFKGLTSHIDVERRLYDRVRAGVRFCIQTLFGDGEQSATQREAALFDAVAHTTIDEEYFKGVHQLLIKKLQQSVSARKPAPASSKQRGATAEASLEDLLSFSAAPSKASPNKQSTAREEPNLSESDEMAPSGPPITQTFSGDLTPLEASGFLWHGKLEGFLINGTQVGLSLWIVPLFSPVPYELRISLRAAPSFSFDRGLSVAQFAGHLTGGAETATRLHVLLGADWACDSPEVVVSGSSMAPHSVLFVEFGTITSSENCYCPCDCG